MGVGVLLRHPLPHPRRLLRRRDPRRALHQPGAGHHGRAGRREGRGGHLRRRPPRPGELKKLPPAIKDAYTHAVANGAHQVFLWGAVITVVGFLAAWFIKEVPLRAAPKSADGETPADVTPVAEPV